jgi:hypothetical protein
MRVAEPRLPASYISTTVAAAPRRPAARRMDIEGRLEVGERKLQLSKRQRFLTDHPFCCFCGGTVAATTTDHVPNRAFFVNRNWPEGYEFPSCSNCQSESRVAELTCAAVMRSAPAPNEVDIGEVVKLYRGLSNNDPGAWKELLGPERTSSLVLPALVQRRLRRPDGSALFNLGPKIHAHIETYVIKLTKALYYKHFGQIVPAQAAVEYFTASNAQVGLPHERLIASMRFPGQPILVRATAPISDQFEYSYLGSNPPGDAVFKIRFHQALIVASTVRLWREL